MNSLVSIIVPCYLQARYLNESLKSVQEQTYQKWECIIVNDGSPDDTEAIAKEWLLKDVRFKYLYQKNGGLSSARNAGIKKSEGTFILPLDADDILNADYLKQTVPILERNQTVAIVGCHIIFFSNEIKNIQHKLVPKGATYQDLMFENQLVATSLFRKNCWDKVGGYDEKMKKGFEDWEFWLAITKGGFEYKIVAESLFYYRKAKKSMLVDTINNYAEANMEYIFRKHSDLYTKHFDNTAEVLFFHIKTHRLGKMKIKNSLEYKLSKLLMKPYRVVVKLFKK